MVILQNLKSNLEAEHVKAIMTSGIGKLPLVIVLGQEYNEVLK